MPLSAVDAIAPAFDHTRAQLRPFQWSQWWRIGVLGFLAGELGTFGCNSPGGAPSSLPSSSPDVTSSLIGLPEWSQVPLPVLLLAATVIGVAIYGFIAAVTYVNSISRFILIETVVARRCDGIRTGWRKWRGIGRRFFVWQLAFQLAMVTALLLLVGVPLAIAASAGWIDAPDQHVAPIALAAMIVMTIGFSVFLAAAVAYVAAKDFVAPVMAVEQIGVADGWRRVLALMRTERWAFVGYFLVKILLTVVAGVIQLVLLTLVMIPFAALAVMAAGAAAAAGIGSPAAWGPLIWVSAIGAGTVVVALLLLLFQLVNVPFVVFFPAYGLHFLAGRYPELEPWLKR